MKHAEKIQSRRRFWRSASSIIAMIVIVVLECMVLASMLNLLSREGMQDLIIYQMIIPVVCGFAAIISIVARKLKPDLYDSYSVTSCATIEQKARQDVELYNYFSAERGENWKLEIIKEEIE